MKDEAKFKCMDDPNINRNILVILTDGYLYYKNEIHRTQNRYSYIERSYEHFKMFRNTQHLNSTFDQKDYGLEPTGENLSDLEVIVIGLNPEEKFPQDFHIMKKYWSKWFEEMKIKRYTFIKTEQPVYTIKMVNDFLVNR